MKAVLIACIILAGCGPSTPEQKPAPATPKALDEKNSSMDVLSKRGGQDLVEDLYAELQTTHPELKELDQKIQALQAGKPDSVRPFVQYDDKIQSYFLSAGRHMGSIKDSVISKKMKAVIAAALDRYNMRVAKQKERLALIDKNEASLGDLLVVLKITRTLPLIEQYQADHFPAAKFMEGYIQEQNAAMRRADSLARP